MSREAQAKLRKELKKLKLMSPMSAEATVVRNYIDWVLSLPWDDRTRDKLNIKEAEAILDEDHYGLQKVKERIIEYLAVQALVKKLKAPSCVWWDRRASARPAWPSRLPAARDGASSDCRWVACATKRKSAAIAAHTSARCPARSSRASKAGSNNPVMLLDEVDKMCRLTSAAIHRRSLGSARPRAESLVCRSLSRSDYDLSDVMFIATANSLHSIPLPLQDRMEIIHLPGYTEWEKLAIAQQYLIPKEREQNGITHIPLDISGETIRSVIHHYTKGSRCSQPGEREISTICRKVAREVVSRSHANVAATIDPGPEALPVSEEKASAKVRGKDKAPDKSADKSPDKAPEKPSQLSRARRSRASGLPARTWPGTSASRSTAATRSKERDEVGLTNGLAVTMHGGELLVTEVPVVPGKGKLVLTGKLGEVMQESAQAAMSYVRSRVDALGLERDFYQKVDLHVHFPRGSAQGWSISRHHHGDQLGVGAAAHSGAARRGDDGRGHAARSRAADWWAEG